MTVLADIIVHDVIANLPAATIPGRLFFSSDTLVIMRDNGSGWDNVTPGSGGGSSPTLVALSPSTDGNFTVAHGLGSAPSAVSVSMTSGGQIWLQHPTGYDSTNLYLTASDAGVTGNAICFV